MSTMFKLMFEHKLFLEPQSFHRAPLSAHFLEQIMCYVLNLSITAFVVFPPLEHGVRSEIPAK